ncbi:hypothetical protein ACA910_005324 [Epithemia clementina (nom. ined.)]
MSQKIFDVIIVGGGLSGLVVGYGLDQLSLLSSSSSTTTAPPVHVNWKLLEARSVLGGRLANNNNNMDNGSNARSTSSEVASPGGSGKIDMGGAWIWPRHQPYMRSLVQDELHLSTFDQPDDPSSTRIEGGAVEIIHALASSIQARFQSTSAISNDTRIQLNTPVISCTLWLPENNNNNDDQTTDHHSRLVRLQTATNQEFLARRVVFAVPPKLLHQHVTFDPPLSASKQAAMVASHTWMAGVTKVALVYANRFWNRRYSNMGLLSPSTNDGPAFQVYDSSTADESVAALTFFTLVKKDPKHVDQKSDTTDSNRSLAKQLATQMAQVWNALGQEAAAQQALSYTSYHVHSWPREKYISEDDRPLTIHPHPHPVRALAEPEWQGLLEFAGSETDQTSPGVMEGAVSAARRVLNSLQQSLFFQY